MTLSENQKDNIKTWSSILSIIASCIGIFVFLRDTKKERDVKKLAKTATN
jgi:hypothetical protein